MTTTNEYYVRSSVTGKVITELDNSGNKFLTKVYVGAAVLAEQRSYQNEVVWQHADPVTGSIQQTVKSGALGARRELEPLGGVVPLTDPSQRTTFVDETDGYQYGGNVSDAAWGCTMPDTGMPAP